MWRTTAAISVLFVAISLQAAAVTVPWDAARDFSTSSNPNGPWSYGFSSNPGTGFAPATSCSVIIPEFVGWCAFQPGAVNGEPWVVKNTSGTTQQGGSMRLVPGQLGMHPGPAAEVAKIRWTAPKRGYYQFDGSFESRSLAGAGATVDVHILLNGFPLLQENISGGFGPGSGPEFSIRWGMQAGDHVDFTVGAGGNGYNSDPTALDVAIQGVPGPSTGLLLVTALTMMAAARTRFPPALAANSRANHRLHAASP